MGISFQTFSGTPPGSLVVGVGGGVPVRVTKVEESGLVFAEGVVGVAPRLTRVLVGAVFVGSLGDSFPTGLVVSEIVLSMVNELVP